MTVQTINIGNRVNDGLGDDLRTAFEKVNANFTELQTSLTVTASNAGTIGIGVFKEKVGADLRFKKLVGRGTVNVLDTPGNDTIEIVTTQPPAFTTITTDIGIVRSSSVVDISLKGKNNARNIQVTASGGTINIDSVLDLKQILLTMDFGPITGQFVNPTQLALQSSNIDFGTIEIPGALDLDLGSP